MKKKIIRLLGLALGMLASFYIGRYIICEAFGHIPFMAGYIVMAIYVYACIKIGQFFMDKVIKLALYLLKQGEK